MTTTDTDLRERSRRRVALMVHEASHAVVAVLHGATITEASIDKDGTKGLTQTDGSLTADGTAAVALAGPVGEARWAYGSRPSIREIQSMLDGQCAADGSGDYDYLLASGGPLPLSVVKLVETCYPAIEAIAMHMINHDGKADHAVICAALGVPEQNPHLSAAASQIRAGFTPTPH